jgi:hypothetical protein
MTPILETDARYPVGKFVRPAVVTPEMRRKFLAVLEDAPAGFRAAVKGLDERQLDTPYRDGGWTVRQVIHHMPDSHMNSYMRFRLALTEDAPAVRGYAEDQWAELFDARTAPIEPSLALLENLHYRWVMLLRSLTDADFARTFVHPAMGPVRLDTNLALYAWHSRHHTAHITRLRERMGW